MTTTTEDLELQLDDQIQRIKSQLTKLKSQKQHLSKTLLGSPRVQKHISSRVDQPRQADLERAVKQAQLNQDVLIHQLTHGVTVYPYTDPSPERAGLPCMLLVKFEGDRKFNAQTINEQTTSKDLPVNNEKSNDNDENASHEPSTILLERITRQDRTSLKVHRNFVPKIIDVEGYEAQYLPLPNVNEETVEQDDSGIDVTMPLSRNTTSAGTGQDLDAFICAIRDDLRSWRARKTAIAKLQNMEGKWGIMKIDQVANDAYDVRITWTNEVLSYVRISYGGTIRRAIAVGPRAIDEGSDISEMSEYETDDDRNVVLAQIPKYSVGHVQLKDWEKILDGGKSGMFKVGELEERLKIVWEKKLKE